MYLDYAAAGLYTNTQIDAHAEDLKEQLYGNPHSLSILASCSSTVVLVNKKQWQIVDAHLYRASLRRMAVLQWLFRRV